MPTIEVEFACRHRQSVDSEQPPVCVVCGESRVARVLNAPAPRFTGCATGPHVVTAALPAIAITVGTAPEIVAPAQEGT